MLHVVLTTRSPKAAETAIAASTKVEFLAAFLTAYEPILEAKEDATTTTS